MKFFKHFVDARTRTGMQLCMKKHGKHKAYACYFILVELCTAKWDLQEPGWEACKFRFSLQHLSQELGTKPVATLLLLASYHEQEFLNYFCSDNVVHIQFHKLLEMLDKHSKYNRKRVVGRSSSATLDKEEDKEEEEDISSPSDAARPRTYLLGFLNSWPKSLPAPQQTPAREKAVARFLAKRSEADWREICSRIEGSEFLSGRSGKWRASFDWALRPKNIEKILSGDFGESSVERSDAFWDYVFNEDKK